MKRIPRIPVITETYRKSFEIINYVVYERNEIGIYDEVLQHKRVDIGLETSHITLHPDGEVNFRIEKNGNKKFLEEAIKNNLKGFYPEVSQKLQEFISKIKDTF